MSSNPARDSLYHSSSPANPAPTIDLDTAKLDQIIGAKGQANGGVYQFGLPRRDPITEGGAAVTPPLGGATAINFQPTGGGKAAITGDEIMPYGVEANRTTLDAFLQYAFEQGVCHKRMKPEELFPPQVQKSFKI